MSMEILDHVVALIYLPILLMSMMSCSYPFVRNDTIVLINKRSTQRNWILSEISFDDHYENGKNEVSSETRTETLQSILLQ
jgi:hypothetical protein